MKRSEKVWAWTMRRVLYKRSQIDMVKMRYDPMFSLGARVNYV
jgi:hypothetical protein